MRERERACEVLVMQGCEFLTYGKLRAISELLAAIRKAMFNLTNRKLLR